VEKRRPPPQYAALYALAARMTVEEAWAEVAQQITTTKVSTV